jgi:hypothetical protein
MMKNVRELIREAIRLNDPSLLPPIRGAAFDSAVMLWNPGANLVATQTGTGLLIEGTGFRGNSCRIYVPQATGTTPTLNVVIQESNDNSAYTPLVTFDQIIAAGTYRRYVSTRKRYVRAVLTVGGTTPNFGFVQVGFDTGGSQLGT